MREATRPLPLYGHGATCVALLVTVPAFTCESGACVDMLAHAAQNFGYWLTTLAVASINVEPYAFMRWRIRSPQEYLIDIRMGVKTTVRPRKCVEKEEEEEEEEEEKHVRVLS